MRQRQSMVETGYRAAINVYIFVLVLAMYSGTSDPTIHIKELLTAWAALLLAGSYVAVTWITRTPLRRPPIFREVLLCLIAFLFLSSLFSEFRAISLLETGRFFCLFALYWLASQVFRREEHVTRFFTTVCVAVALAAVYALMQAAGLDPFPWKERTSDTYTNLPATFGNPNFAAHALILAIIMAIGLYRAGLRWVLWLMPLYLFHLYRTDQRAGWIAMAGAAMLVGIAWVLLRRTRRPTLAVSAAVIGTVAVGGAIAIGAMYVTHARTGHAFPLDLSLLLRYQSYVSATNMLLDAPVLGHGPAVYGLAYAPYWTPFEQEWFAQETRMNAHVHNDLIELAIDGGIAAAGLYLATLLLGICYGLLLAVRGATPGQRRLGFVFAALITAFAIDGLFGFNLRVPVTAALFFLLLGLLDGLWAGDAAPAPRRNPWPGRAARLAFVLVLLLAARQESRAFLGEYHFQAGMRAHNQGELSTARESYRRAEAAAPWNWHAPRRVGMTLLDEGKATEARPHLERALELNPYYLLGRLPMARASLMLAQESIQGEDKDPEAAAAYFEEARKHAGHILDAAPQFPAAHGILARLESIAALAEKKRGAAPDAPEVQAHWLAAREHFNKAIERGPDNTSALYRMLVRVELNLDNQEGAFSAAMGAVQTAGDDENSAWSLFLNLARETGDFAPLRRALYQRIGNLQENGEGENDVKLALAYDWLGTVQAEGFQDTVGALDAFEQAVRFGPMRPAAWSRFAALAYENDARDRLETVVVESCQAIEAENREPLPQVAAVRAVIEQGPEQLDQASLVLLAGVRSHAADNPISPKESFGWAARLLLDRYRAATESTNAYCECALNLGIVSAAIREFGVADQLLEKAHGCLQGEMKAIAAIHWADTLVRTGRAPDALSLLEKSGDAFPEHVDTQWAWARTLAQMGRTEEARARYNTLLELPGIDENSRAQLQAERDALSGPGGAPKTIAPSQ